MSTVFGMGPFNLLEQKGQSRFSGAGVPVRELPLTRGGIAANGKCYFGRVAYADPAAPSLLYGYDPADSIPAGQIPLGVFAMSLARMVRNVARNDRYLQNEPCDLFTYGELEYYDYDPTLKVRQPCTIQSVLTGSPYANPQTVGATVILRYQGMQEGADAATAKANAVAAGAIANSIWKLADKSTDPATITYSVYDGSAWTDLTAQQVKDTMLSNALPGWFKGGWSWTTHTFDPPIGVNSRSEPAYIAAGAPTGYYAAVYSFGEGKLHHMIQIMVDFTNAYTA